jgi:hypothetical protein
LKTLIVSNILTTDTILKVRAFQSIDVRFRGQSGHKTLPIRMSAYDPKQARTILAEER